MNYLEILEHLPELRVYNDKEYNLNISYRFQKFDDELPILFLHGFNGNSKSWAYQFMYFKNLFHNESRLKTDDIMLNYITNKKILRKTIY